jgi:transcription antitermination factor NusG
LFFEKLIQGKFGEIPDMPVLAKETYRFPETLLESVDSIADGLQWMVVYTKPRQEKSLARDLLRQTIPFYLPLVKKHLQYGRRRIASFAPLFDGYLFMLGSEKDRSISWTTNRVLRILPVNDEERLITDLRQIERLIEANVPLTVESRLHAGMHVRVRSGLMVGVEGVILRRRGETRLLVSVNFLQQGASVEIEDFRLEAID